MAVAGIAGVAVVVAVASTGVIVGAAKDAITVEVEAALMVPPMIRRVPSAEAAVCSAARPGTAVDVAIHGRATVARGATAPHGPVAETSGGQSRSRRYYVPRNDPRRERCFRLVVAGRGKLEVEAVYCRVFSVFALRNELTNVQVQFPWR